MDVTVNHWLDWFDSSIWCQISNMGLREVWISGQVAPASKRWFESGGSPPILEVNLNTGEAL